MVDRMKQMCTTTPGKSVQHHPVVKYAKEKRRVRDGDITLGVNRTTAARTSLPPPPTCKSREVPSMVSSKQTEIREAGATSLWNSTERLQGPHL